MTALMTSPLCTASSARGASSMAYRWVTRLASSTFPVDVVVTSPGTLGDAHHRRAWELLLADAELRRACEAGKAAGMTADEKRDFFEYVVSFLRD